MMSKVKILGKDQLGDLFIEPIEFLTFNYDDQRAGTMFLDKNYLEILFLPNTIAFKIEWNE